MTSALVTPTAGYSTLSRLDSSRLTPATFTVTRSLIDALRRGLVRPQPLQPWEAQAPVRGQLPVPDLHHHLRPYPGGVLGVLARQVARERRAISDQRTQGGQQRTLLCRGDAPTDPATQVQPAVRAHHPDQKGADRAGAALPAAHHEVVGVVVFVLDPVRRAHTRPVRAGQPLGDDALKRELG